MLTLLLSVSLASAAPPKTPGAYGDRAAIGVVVGEVYGGAVIGLGGWWIASQVDADKEGGLSQNNALMYTAPLGAAAGGILGGTIAAHQTWGPVSLATAGPMAIGLGVTAGGFAAGSKPMMGVGVGIMAVGPPIAARYTALHYSQKRGDGLQVGLVPIGNGIGLAGRW